MPMRPEARAAAPAAGGAPQRFNFFQRMMLRWRELHPYNPVHVLRLPVPLQAARLRDAIAALLETQGLTGLNVDRRRWRYGFAGGPAQVELRLVEQVTGRVRWRESIAAMWDAGVTDYVEVGAKVLGPMVKRIAPDATVTSIITMDDIEAALAAF